MTWHPAFTVILSWLGAALAFLFTAWINNSMKTQLLQLQLELAKTYVTTDRWTEVKDLISGLTAKVEALQRLIDRRVEGLTATD